MTPAGADCTGTSCGTGCTGPGAGDGPTGTYLDFDLDFPECFGSLN